MNIAREVTLMEEMTVDQLRTKYAEVFGEPFRSRHKPVADQAHRLVAFQENARGEAGQKADAAAAPTLRNPERRETIASANRGRQYRKSTIAKMRRSHQGKKRTQESIDKQLATRRRNNSRSRNDGRLWTETEDALFRQLSVKEVAAQNGRTLQAVYSRRHVLGVTRRGRRLE